MCALLPRRGGELRRSDPCGTRDSCLESVGVGYGWRGGGGVKRGMEVWGRGLSDSASVPADVAKRVDLPTTMAMLVITAANADTVLTYAFPHTTSFKPPPKCKEVTI